MEEPLQKSLERYDVLDRIAVGGMAEVFLAKAYGAHGFEKTLAIKRVRALDFAHSHNVVHRDVSPSNILISRAGEVKIADFGIAIAASPHRGGGAGPRKVMGKWRYMSPEQTRGDTLDTRSDLFS